MGDPAVGAALDDPDSIATRPPPKAIEVRTFFQTGSHEGKWSEYDDRGVPSKNLKKKKPTKKEKDQLEAEYLEASKAYQKYLKDVETWEQAKLDSEKELKRSDRLRWSFRQVGQKHEPINANEMETIIKFMGWKALNAREFKVVTKGLSMIANSDGQIELEALRKYVAEVMPLQLLEDRLLGDQLDSIELEDLYSPRTWRRKVEEDPPARKGSGSARSAKVSPRRSGRKVTGQLSARGKAKGKTKTWKKEEDQAQASPRGNKPRSASASKRG